MQFNCDFVPLQLHFYQGSILKNWLIFFLNKLWKNATFVDHSRTYSHTYVASRKVHALKTFALGVFIEFNLSYRFNSAEI